MNYLEIAVKPIFKILGTYLARQDMVVVVIMMVVVITTTITMQDKT